MNRPDPLAEPTRARLEAAAAALATLLRFDRPADVALRIWFREHPELGPRERAFVAESAFAVLRHLRRLEHATGGRAARPLLLASLLLSGRGVRALSPLLREDEGAMLAQLRQPQAELPPAVRLSLPDWLHERLLAEHGADTVDAVGQALLQPAPLDLRVNTWRARRDEVIAALHASGLEAEATPLSPTGVRLRGKPSIERHSLLAGGHVEVQDEGSQLVCLLMEARRGQMVVDFCAGAGGKTLALGALMRSEGRVYAFDTSERRLANLGPRLKRSGLSNVHPQRIDSETDVRVKRLAGRIDAVLVDAPCSGTGTLRRNPDLKWRMDPQALDELGAKQAAILASAARLPRPGGRLVYATCSLLAQENEAVVDAFLQTHPGWRRLHAGEVLARQSVPIEGLGQDLRLLPHLHGTDGFYAAVLEREPG